MEIPAHLVLLSLMETLQTPPDDVPGSSLSLGKEFSGYDLRAELESASSPMDKTLNFLRRERDEAIAYTADLIIFIGQISCEKDSYSERVHEIEASAREKEDKFAARIERLKNEAEISRERIRELEIEREKGSELMLKFSNSVRSVKERLCRIIDDVDEEKIVNGFKDSNLIGTELDLDEELGMITRLSAKAEEKVNEYKENRNKEKRELENSVVSLTEENRDISNLLRVALLEKEAVERRLKGNSENKRVAILQMAERGLQRVGFGFMMGGGNSEQLSEISGAKSDSSECEEDTVSLASTVEKIMKNLRTEITQLRRSLDESRYPMINRLIIQFRKQRIFKRMSKERSDTERLQSLTEKQAQDIVENTLYIKELEERERVLAENVEDLLMEIKETEAEVARWREACELEVEAGKVEIGERDKMVAILKQELERTKAALDISNGKLKLKEELAAAAMTAQAAAEKSLELADSRAVGLRQRIEELSRQVEELESRERSSQRVRHICWPWRVLKANAL